MFWKIHYDFSKVGKMCNIQYDTFSMTFVISLYLLLIPFWSIDVIYKNFTFINIIEFFTPFIKVSNVEVQEWMLWKHPKHSVEITDFTWNQFCLISGGQKLLFWQFWWLWILIFWKMSKIPPQKISKLRAAKLLKIRVLGAL